MAVIFNLVKSGSSTVGLDGWLDLGLIPTGYQVWIGYITWTSPNKAITFELRGNAIGKSAGNTTDTLLYSTTALKKGATSTVDLYKSGRMTVRTVKGTGVEHWWIHAKSTTSTSGSYTYKIQYLTY